MTQPQARHEPSPVSREDVAASLAARRELGTEYEREIADSLADRIEAAVVARAAAERANRPSRDALWLGLGSLAAGIPITAISGSFGHNAGMLLAWGGIGVVNLAHAFSRHRPG